MGEPCTTRSNTRQARDQPYEEAPVEDEMDVEQIKLPEYKSTFSFRTLWAFTGPGFLMSIAYLDPGNIESDLQSGAKAGYKLLWVLLSAHVMGMLLQRMSARLGVVSGKNMAEVARSFYPIVPRLLLWVMIEIAIICSDMQEVIGTAIAFYLLSNGWIPLYAGVLITILDTFTFLFVDRYGVRKLEVIFALLITTMAVTFGYEFFIVRPSVPDVLSGMFIPWCAGCGKEELLQGISIVGAVIMPHNLYLHSALVKSRKVDRTKRERMEEANFYYTIESALALCVSFVINMFVVSVFAHGLYQKTNWEVRDTCDKHPGVPDPGVFPYNNNTVETDIYKAGMFLGCEFGLVALFVWAIGIFAAGQSSTMTGTYAGQFVMEGFIKVAWPRWKRVFVTRAIAIGPTLAVTFYAKGVYNLTGMNDLLNCVQMIQLPFALIPIITFTSSAKIMHDFKSSKTFQIFALSAAALILAINVYFITDFVSSSLGSEWYVYVALAIPTVAYVCFVSYLTIYCFVACGLLPETLTIRGFNFTKNFENDAPWLDNTPRTNEGYISEDSP